MTDWIPRLSPAQAAVFKSNKPLMLMPPRNYSVKTLSILTTLVALALKGEKVLLVTPMKVKTVANMMRKNGYVCRAYRNTIIGRKFDMKWKISIAVHKS